MLIEPKQIIDKHFSDNYNYYRFVCYKYYKGRYLFEDLLHELYFKLLNEKEFKILKYHKDEKLKVLVIYRLRDLFRSRSKNNLSEKCNFELLEKDFVYLQDEEPEINENKMELIKNSVWSQLAKSDIDMQVFVASQAEPIYLIAKRSGISTTKLTSCKNRAALKLKRIWINN